MNRMMRSSALSLALGYVALGIAALVLFAAPLWYAWQVTIQDGRSEILQADAQRLTDVFRRDGADGLKTFIDARVGMQIAGERILLLTDASLRPLAGNLPALAGAMPRRSRQLHDQRSIVGDRVHQDDAGARRPARAATICWWAATIRCFAPLEQRILVRTRRPPSRCCRSPACWSASSPAARSCRASTASARPCRPSFTAI